MRCRKTVSKKSIHNFARGMFYAGDGRTPWEPLEHYPKEQIDEMVYDMEYALTEFLKPNGRE